MPVDQGQQVGCKTEDSEEAKQRKELGGKQAWGSDDWSVGHRVGLEESGHGGCRGEERG